MTAMIAQLLPVLVLMALGAILGRRGFLSSAVIDGLKRLIASVSLPAVLFLSFARVAMDWPLLGLAAAVFAACGLSGAIGAVYARLARLPRPAAVFLFQGYEAGMLGYALFSSFYGELERPAFATADLGQVVFVISVLLAQLRSAGQSAAPAAAAPMARFRRFASGLKSPALVAIALGLLSAAVSPGAAGLPWGTGGFLEPALSLIAGLTMPLVCLVVGYDLKDGVRGARAVVLTVVGRLAVSSACGAVLAFAVAPALGFPAIMVPAILTLFLLPPPFVIPVYRERSGDAAYIGSTLSLHTVVSLIAVAAVAIGYRLLVV